MVQHDDDFETCTFEEFMTGMSIWELPSSHQFLMRVYNKKTTKSVSMHTNKIIMHVSVCLKSVLILTMRLSFVTTILFT